MPATIPGILASVRKFSSLSSNSYIVLAETTSCVESFLQELNRIENKLIEIGIIFIKMRCMNGLFEIVIRTTFIYIIDRTSIYLQTY